MVGKSKTRRRTSDGLNIFKLCLRFLIKFNKNVALQGNGKKMTDFCEEMVAYRPKGSPYLLLAGSFGPKGSSPLNCAFPKMSLLDC